MKSYKTLHFPEKLSADEDLSAVAILGPNLYLIGGDEGHEVDLLLRDGDGGFELIQKLLLVDDPEQGEVDIEDICCEGSLCYVVGSHSRKRKKVKPKTNSYRQNRDRIFRQPLPEPNRAVLYRLSIDLELMQISIQSQESLTSHLSSNPLLEPFMSIPSKENGIDIEGLAIKDDQLFVGFRSPVLRGNYVPILVVNTRDFQDDELRFIRMGGRGVRALTETQSGFLVLGGPPGDGEGTYQVYFWDGEDMIPGNDRPSVAPLATLATLEIPNGTKAEGLAVVSEDENSFDVLVIFDGITGGQPSLYQIPKPHLA